MNERAERVRLAGRYRERKSNFDLIHRQMSRIARTCSQRALRVLDLRALFAGTDNVDVLAGTAGSSLVGMVSPFCKGRLRGLARWKETVCERLCKRFRNSFECVFFGMNLQKF